MPNARSLSDTFCHRLLGSLFASTTMPVVGARWALGWL